MDVVPAWVIVGGLSFFAGWMCCLLNIYFNNALPPLRRHGSGQSLRHPSVAGKLEAAKTRRGYRVLMALAGFPVLLLLWAFNGPMWMAVAFPAYALVWLWTDQP